MVDELEDLPKRVHALEQKLDALGASVDESFAEQRRYTEFAFGELRAEMDQRFEAVDRRFDTVDLRFDAVDRRFDAVDRRFDAVDRRFDAVDVRFDRLEQKIEWIIDHLTGEQS